MEVIPKMRLLTRLCHYANIAPSFYQDCSASTDAASKMPKLLMHIANKNEETGASVISGTNTSDPIDGLKITDPNIQAAQQRYSNRGQ
jgi:hypothetical protein